jgi:hypothetical protein
LPLFIHLIAGSVWIHTKFIREKIMTLAELQGMTEEQRVNRFEEIPGLSYPNPINSDEPISKSWKNSVKRRCQKKTGMPLWMM